ncbi:hypothetical protein SAMN05661010_02321 [Modicisalibacter muralis]|uniref:Uncharacterized protein n=1 Tax=Modicisalibacter muralis TaxID=119000 RepID=A0A1G9M656_9GAMM|nr:hypothetical protein [Halomonas muralis]SDL69698.1 hypothetical protein SAMN05661010_02321 [Halomonas muralis]
MSRIMRIRSAAAMLAASFVVLAQPALAQAENDIPPEVQAQLTNSYIEMAAGFYGIGVMCGASDAELEESRNKQLAMLAKQPGIPADYEQRYEAAIAKSEAEVAKLSPAERKQTCDEIKQSVEDFAAKYQN